MLNMNKAIQEYIIYEDCSIYEFLKNKLNKSKNNLKTLFLNKCIYVNNKVVNSNYIAKKNDVVLVYTKFIKYLNFSIRILYEDDYFICVDKPYGFLSVSTLKEDRSTLYSVVREYLKKLNKKNKLFILHRLDKDTSGILLFAKNEKLKKIMQDNWNTYVKKRGYVAIVNGTLKNDFGVIKSYLKELNNLKVVSSKRECDGKLAITNYEVIKKGKNYSLLQLFLDTGRKNQIRVHMNDIGTYVIGDKKYGKNEKKRMYLHSNIFMFYHPILKKDILINCNPNDFNIKL